ncbi:uncharacterized protein [Dysidea avara]
MLSGWELFILQNTLRRSTRWTKSATLMSIDIQCNGVTKTISGTDSGWSEHFSCEAHFDGISKFTMENKFRHPRIAE